MVLLVESAVTSWALKCCYIVAYFGIIDMTQYLCMCLS